MKTVKVRATFFNDHHERGLPCPKIVKDQGSKYVVALDDPHLPELLSDAEFYADDYGPDNIPAGLKASARATARAIHKAMDE